MTFLFDASLINPAVVGDINKLMYMRPFLKYVFLSILLIGQAAHSPCQELFFNRVEPPEGKFFEHVTGMTQDKLGYMWLATKKRPFQV